MTTSTRAAANIDKLPEMSATFIEAAEPGKRIGLIKRGESGYYLTDYDTPKTSEQLARETVNHINARLGVTPAQAIAMEIGSMCGWHVPGADPDRHSGVAQ